MFSCFCVYPFDVSFAIFRTVSKVKENDILVRNSANLRTSLNGRFTFLTSYFHFSHTHTHKFRFWLRDFFSIAWALFQDFLSCQTHILKISLWFLETEGSTTDAVYGLLLLWRASQDSIDTTVSLSLLFFFCNIRTVEISYSKKDSHKNTKHS